MYHQHTRPVSYMQCNVSWWHAELARTTSNQTYMHFVTRGMRRRTQGAGSTHASCVHAAYRVVTTPAASEARASVALKRPEAVAAQARPARCEAAVWSACAAGCTAGSLGRPAATARTEVQRGRHEAPTRVACARPPSYLVWPAWPVDMHIHMSTDCFDLITVTVQRQCRSWTVTVGRLYAGCTGPSAGNALAVRCQHR